MANSGNRTYTQKERDYIRRIAGKVPTEVIAAQLQRSIGSVRNWAYFNDVKLRVPHRILVKYWSEYANPKAKMQK